MRENAAYMKETDGKEGRLNKWRGVAGEPKENQNYLSIVHDEDGYTILWENGTQEIVHLYNGRVCIAYFLHDMENSVMKPFALKKKKIDYPYKVDNKLCQTTKSHLEVLAFSDVSHCYHTSQPGVT